MPGYHRQMEPTHGPQISVEEIALDETDMDRGKYLRAYEEDESMGIKLYYSGK